MFQCLELLFTLLDASVVQSICNSNVPRSISVKYDIFEDFFSGLGVICRFGCPDYFMSCCVRGVSVSLALPILVCPSCSLKFMASKDSCIFSKSLAIIRRPYRCSRLRAEIIRLHHWWRYAWRSVFCHRSCIFLLIVILYTFFITVFGAKAVDDFFNINWLGSHLDTVRYF